MADPWAEFRANPTTPEAAAAAEFTARTAAPPAQQPDPWAEFRMKPATPDISTQATEAGSSDPWAEFRPKQRVAPVAQLEPQGPGFFGHALEVGKGIAGAPQSMIGTAIKGAAIGARGFSRDQINVMNDIDAGVNVPEVQDPIGYKWMNPQQRAEARAGVERSIATPIQETPMFQTGGAIQGFGSEFLAPRPGVTPGLARAFGSGLGSVATGIGMSLVPGVGTPAAMATFALGGSGEAVDDAVKAGATQEQIERAGRFGTVAGALDVVDILLPTLGSTGKALGFIKRVGVPALEAAFAEGGTEGIQQFIQNVIARNIYDPNRDLTKDVAQSALVGALVGGAVRGGVGIAAGRPPAAAPSQVELDTAYKALTGGGEPPAAVAPGEHPAPTTPSMPLTTSPISIPPTVSPATTTPSGGQLSLPLETPVEVEAANAAAALRPPALPGGEVMPPGAMPNDIADFLNTTPSTVSTPLEVPQGQVPLDKLLQDRMEQRIKAAPGANTARLARLLGPKLYGNPSEMVPVTIKEMLQNSFDALKTVLQSGKQSDGNIDIITDPTSRNISVVDNGSGMTADVLGNQFLQIAGTKKEAEQASGGLGIAKMMFLFGNQDLQVITMRNGKVSQLTTTGPQLFGALDNPKMAPDITVRDPTPADRDLFPRGHGTAVKVSVPKDYKDTSTGENREIKFHDWVEALPSLGRSPLFHNIQVTLNGDVVPIGSSFPSNDYTQFANVNFDWGKANIYVSKADHKIEDWENDNTHVLSNGLWQFSFPMTKKPGDMYGPKIQKTFFIDVSPEVRPEDPGYPFDLNRQQFARQAQDDFAKIFKYVSLVYQQDDFGVEVENFGDMQYLTFDPGLKIVGNTGAAILKPPIPAKPTPVAGIKPGDKVTVKDGKLVVNGRAIPELKLSDIEKFRLDIDGLTIPQSQIKNNDVMLHDNSWVSPTGGPLTDGAPRISMTQLAVQKFGNRFYEYTYFMGRAFKDLRDVVKSFSGYEGLANEAIGISLDINYRGVSIRVPFSASFLNPFAPRYNDPVRAAVGMITTMTHELAHHTHRSETDLAPVIQDLWTQLEAHQTFNFQAFKQRVVNVVNNYHDVMTYVKGVYDDGNVESRGKRLKTGSSEEQGGSLSDAGDPTRGQLVERPDGSKLSDWVAVSEASVGRGAGPTGGRATASPSGADPSFGINANRRAVERANGAPGIPASPRQPETQTIADKIDQLFEQNPPPAAKEFAAHADTINWFYKWFAGLLELVSANPRFSPLIRYAQKISASHREEATAQDAAQRIVKDWRKLGAQGENLTGFLDDLTNMTYLSPKEVKQGVVRQPTVAELQALQRKHQLDSRAITLAGKIKNYFDTFLDIVSQNAVDDARRLITDPVKVAQRIDEIKAQVRNLKAKPYFPFMRFGRHYLTVRDAAGNVLLFETFERKGLISAERVQQKREAELVRSYGRKAVSAGILPENTESLVGLPRTLLEHMKQRLKLTPSQLDAMEQLQFELSPSLSFKHNFQHKNYIKGYSKDFARSFARYAFHGARYNARVKYVWQLEEEVRNARAVGGNKAHRIADYMADHLDKTILNAKGDQGIFKGAIFLWTMGYVPAAATQNLSQTPMITYPYLAGKYGDVKAVRAISRAISSATTYYRKGSLDGVSDFELKALGYGIKTGRVNETQAAELAALSNGSNLIYGTGGNPAQRATVWMMENAALMFEMAEQFNRRVVFRAALDLAMNDTNSREVNEAVNRYQNEYEVLVNKEGFSPQQARAVIAANHATEQTQFVYARYARPRFMRGKLPGTVFVFKRYIQGVVMLMANNKKDVLPRYLLMSMLMGGMGGIPGYDDLKELVEAAFKMLGYNVDPETEIRRYIKQLFNGTVPPDMILHGLSRRGFGLPALLDTLGSYATGRPGRGLLLPKPGENVPFPILDRSKAITPGPLLPIEIGKLLQPGKDPDKVISEQSQRASGAVFSVGFNLYHALMDQRAVTDPKRWERAMPRMLGGVSKAFRTYTEGRERGKGGELGAPTIVNYDTRDAEQVAEIIAQGLGYNTLRQSAAWDRILAQQEHIVFMDTKRKHLMEQFNEARLGQQPQEIAEVKKSIDQFNASIRGTEDRGKMITLDSLMASMQARTRDKVMKERGLSTRRSDIPIAQDIQSLFPENVIDVKRR